MRILFAPLVNASDSELYYSVFFLEKSWQCSEESQGPRGGSCLSHRHGYLASILTHQVPFVTQVTSSVRGLGTLLEVQRHRSTSLESHAENEWEFLILLPPSWSFPRKAVETVTGSQITPPDRAPASSRKTPSTRTRFISTNWGKKRSCLSISCYLFRSGRFRSRTSVSCFEDTTCVFSALQNIKQPWDL